MPSVKSTIIRRISALAVTLVSLVAVLVGAGTSPAAADAYGCDNWGGFTADVRGVPVKIPAGSICQRILGNGRNITYQRADFYTSPCVSGWRIDWVYINNSNQIWYRDTGPTQTGCNTHGTRTRGTGYAQYGLACAYLYIRGVYINRQCHQITS